ncbi:MAG: IS3 family transposase [Bacillota bacterium]
MKSYLEVYERISEYMKYYNNRRRHGSLNNKAPAKYYQAFKSKKIKPETFSA